MKNRLITAGLFLLVMGCGKKDSPAPTPAPVPAPTKVILTLPKQNEACTDGTIISSTQSSVLFSWAASANTDSYELSLKNLLTGLTASQTTTATQLQITLLRNTPYSWSIISKSNVGSTATQSDVWRFYNAGSGTVSYAPYPAEILAPAFGQSISATGGTVDLSWKGSAIDANITGYDVYFGTGTSPAILKSGITDSFLKSVSVTSGTQYYWKVITKDANGNTSDSGLFQFKVN